MLFYFKCLARLPIENHGMFVNKIKFKQLPFISRSRQIHSCLFHRSFIVCTYSKVVPQLLNENKHVFSNSRSSDCSLIAINCNISNAPCMLRYHSVKYYCSSASEPEVEKKPSLFQRFKQMYKDYWYVLVPVHLVTSAFWFSSFYYLTKSGVDIAGILEAIGAGEKLVEKLRNGNSTMGYLAISYALYKIATPIRYTVTLGGTTLSIKYLRDWGYIKPIPPKDKIKEMIHEKKDIFMERKENLKSRYKKRGFMKTLKNDQDKKD